MDTKEIDKSTKKKVSPPLPWWVEVLFVQIGLPDKWLRYFLKSRKQLITSLSKNQGSIKYTLVLLIALIYTNPIIKQSSYQNNCITDTKQNINSGKLRLDPKYKDMANAFAYRYCNGGD
tara:strand:+ start:126 stop:482 length:357 start_codon:yes stop_codon:yes gene_type:complete